MDLPGSVTVPFPCFNPILLVFAQCQGWFYYYLSDGTLGLLCTNSISPIVCGIGVAGVYHFDLQLQEEAEEAAA
jgi:hypothetical protein